MNEKLNIVNKKLSDFSIYNNGTWQSEKEITTSYCPDLGFLRFSKKHEKETKIIAKFDYKEKLALGCLYMKDKFIIQSQNHYVRFRIVHPEGKANFMVFLKNVFEFDFKVGPHLATHFYNGPSKLELDEMHLKSLYDAERVSNRLLNNETAFRDHIIQQLSNMPKLGFYCNILDDYR